MGKKVKQVRMMTLPEFDQRFPHEEACRAYLHEKRWPDGVVKCPRCNNENVYELEHKAWHWQCHHCAADGYRFSLLVGTIFENTNYPLLVWFKVILIMLSSKKGMSALQVQRMFGMGSYRTAWHMCHRIRGGLQHEHFRKLIGFVEVDETYVGGKAKNKHRGPGGRGDFGGRGGTNKAIVVGAVQRRGNVVARVIENTSMNTLDGFVRETVSDRVSLLSTDEHKITTHTASWITVLANTFTAQFIPTPSTASGRSSSGASWAPFTRSVTSTYRCTSRSSSSDITIARMRTSLARR